MKDSRSARTGRLAIRILAPVLATMVAAAPGRAVPADEKPAAPSKAATAATASPDKVATAKGDLEIFPVEHASLVLRWNGKTVYVDPVWGADRYAKLPAADLVVITHDHFDHYEAATLRTVARGTAMLIVPQVVAGKIEKDGGDLAKAPRKVLANGEKATVEGIGIEAVPMYNLSEDRKKFHEKGSGNGYILDLAGTRVYIAGDSEATPEMKALKDISVAFLPVNLPFTMTSEQAAEAILAFKPKVVYPYHYRGQDIRKLKTLVEEKSKEIEVRLRDWYPNQAQKSSKPARPSKRSSKSSS
jgi:L-ascorbate metabolism protein UlaG (beta-lactamase superfamily)